VYDLLEQGRRRLTWKPRLLAARIAVVLAVHFIGGSLSAAEKTSRDDQPNPSSSTGMYSDGWIGGNFTTYLLPRDAADILVVQGELPELSASGATGTTLHVTINGTSVGDRMVKPGSFAVAVPVPSGGFTLRIETSPLARLPEPDGRLIACRLTRFKLLDSADLSSATLPEGALLQVLDAHGIDSDGWAGQNVSLTLPTAHQGVLHLHLQLPEWSGLTLQHLTVSVANETRPDIDLRPGANDVEIPLGGQQPAIVLKSASPFKIPAPDGRVVSYLIESIRLSR
jgi:hypothetical protein